MKNCNLSLVLALYNEASHLKASFQEIIKVLTKTDWNWEIIFVDDKSTDNTLKILEEILQENPNLKIKTILHSQNTGRGKAVTDGIKIAEGEVVGFIDVDLEVSPAYIPQFLQKILEGADMAIGQRLYKFSFLTIDRYITSRGYSALVRFLFKLPFRDTEAGYKFFRRSKILSLLKEIKDPGWFWDTECVVRAYLHNFKIVSVTVIFTRNFNKKSTVRIFSDTLDYFKKLFKFYREVKKQTPTQNAQSL